ncbi:MAG: hypothetical protein P8Y70_18755 [Candidatus Lokiarchaeota archaeon]
MVSLLLEIINGITLLTLCSISITLGIKIVSRYFELKNRIYLFVGFTWIFLTSPWYPGAISFIYALFTKNALPESIYFIIGNIFIPIALFLWITAFTDLIYENHQKLIQTIFLIFGVIFYIVFFVLLIYAPNQIGTTIGITDVKYTGFIVVYSLIVLVIELGTGILFGKQSFKSDNPEVKLKGKFLILAFVIFVIGVGFDALTSINFITLPIMRTLEILSAFLFYLGFILPKRIKNIFLLKKG